jgi:RNA polymerase sigma factor (sigma-70 family)
VALRDRFPDTSWTLLDLACAQHSEGARAREDFAERYHRPIREFLLVIVGDADVAQDLTQEFFARLTRQGGLFRHAERELGAFRTYLMRALRNLAIDHHRRAGRRDAHDTHPDQWSDGGWDTLDLPAFRSAEAAFHRAWVKTVLSEALVQVRRTCAARGQQVHLDLFEGRYLAPSDHVPSWDDLGAKHGLDQKTARTRADTVARHFRIVLRRMLRQQIAVPGAADRGQATATEAAVDREIEALLGPLS